MLSLRADWTSEFTWNTKQIFVYANVEFETRQNKRNEMVMWSKLLTSKVKGAGGQMRHDPDCTTLVWAGILPLPCDADTRECGTVSLLMEHEAGQTRSRDTGPLSTCRTRRRSTSLAWSRSSRTR